MRNSNCSNWRNIFFSIRNLFWHLNSYRMFKIFRNYSMHIHDDCPFRNFHNESVQLFNTNRSEIDKTYKIIMKRLVLNFIMTVIIQNWNRISQFQEITRPSDNIDCVSEIRAVIIVLLFYYPVIFSVILLPMVSTI